jgi:hypothetical protein
MSDSGSEKILPAPFLWECTGVSEMALNCHTMHPRRSLPISTTLNTISLQTFPRVRPSNVSFPHPRPINTVLPIIQCLPTDASPTHSQLEAPISWESAPYEYGHIFEDIRRCAHETYISRPPIELFHLNHLRPAYGSPANFPQHLSTLCGHHMHPGSTTCVLRVGAYAMGVRR